MKSNKSMYWVIGTNNGSGKVRCELFRSREKAQSYIDAHGGDGYEIEETTAGGVAFEVEDMMLFGMKSALQIGREEAEKQKMERGLDDDGLTEYLINEYERSKDFKKLKNWSRMVS